jgi:protein TonB
MLKSPLPEPAMRAMGLMVAACLGVAAGSAAWAASPTAQPRDEAAPSAVQRVAQAKTDHAAGLAAYLQSPNWNRRPGVEDLMKTYPAEAQKAKLGGDVVLHCHVELTGKLTGCGVLSETPQGAGFGAAALKLTDLFEARENPPEGGPKRGTDIRIPIRFRMPNAPAPSKG